MVIMYVTVELFVWMHILGSLKKKKFNLQVNVTSDFGTPESFCAEINGVNATVSNSDFRPGDSIMIVTLNISSTDVCSYSNVTVKVCAVRDNVSTPFSNPITVHVVGTFTFT